jgi:hypothetical protein
MTPLSRMAKFICVALIALLAIGSGTPAVFAPDQLDRMVSRIAL